MNPPVTTSRSAYFHYSGCFDLFKKISETQPVVFDKTYCRFRYSAATLFACFPEDIKDMFVSIEDFLMMFNVTLVMDNGERKVLDRFKSVPLDFFNIAYLEIEDNHQFLSNPEIKDVNRDTPPFLIIKGAHIHKDTGNTHLTCHNCGHFDTVEDFVYIKNQCKKLLFCVPHIKLDHLRVPLCSKCMVMNYLKTDDPLVPYTKRTTTMRKSAKR